MCSPGSPTPPDYAGAARETAASQRVNYRSPWGSINWSPPADQQTQTGPTMGGPTPSISGPLRSTRQTAGGGSGVRALEGDVGDTPGVGGGVGEGPGAGGGGDPTGGVGAGGSGGGGGPSTGDGNPGNPGGGVGSGGGSGGGSGNSMMPWTQTLQLSPEQQQLLDAQNRTSLGMAGLQGQGLDAVRGVFNHMPSQSQLGAPVVNPGQTGQDAIMQRMQPLLNRQQDRMQNQLANQGIQVGSQAYSDAQGDFGRQANDAYSQAALHGIDLTQQARQQAMGEQGFYSHLPIDLLNAARQGSQVQTPQGGSGGPQANYLGAAQAQGQAALGQYGANVGQYNNTMGTIGTIAAAYF